MPNPLTSVLAFLDADVANLPAGTTYSTSFPSRAITSPHVQFAWDGTPSDAANREDTVVRFTVWAPKGKPSDAQGIAGDLRARLVAWAEADVQRVDRGAGRLPGTDPDTSLPFCTFTVGLVMRALTA